MTPDMDLRQALAIIDTAAERSGKEHGARNDVVGALQFLATYGIERDTLTWFWSALHGDNGIGRSQNANASRNRIKWLIGQGDAGAIP